MQEEIVVKTRFNENGEIESGISDIFSKLIQECGRWTECYNSDILFDFDNIKTLFKYENWKDYKHHSVKENGDEVCVFKFGFRKYGVDHIEFIECRKDSEYRAIWNLEIRKFKEAQYYWETVQFTLTREM